MPTTKPPKLNRTDLESKFQAQVKKWLESQGCEVFILTPGGGIPTSTEDVLFLKEGFWGFLECKKSKNAKKRPGQVQTVARHNKMSYSRFTYPENWEEVKKELEQLLK